MLQIAFSWIEEVQLEVQFLQLKCPRKYYLTCWKASGHSLFLALLARDLLAFMQQYLQNGLCYRNEIWFTAGNTMKLDWTWTRHKGKSDKAYKHQSFTQGDTETIVFLAYRFAMITELHPTWVELFCAERESRKAGRKRAVARCPLPGTRANSQSHQDSHPANKHKPSWISTQVQPPSCAGISDDLSEEQERYLLHNYAPLCTQN